MNVPTKLAVFGLGLAVIFGASAGVGSAVGPVGELPRDRAAHPAAGDGHGTHGGGSSEHGEPEVSVPGGLSAARDGYSLRLLDESVDAGAPADIRFVVAGPDGRPVTAYDKTHDEDLHLIAVSRDLGDFQHVHPRQDAGVWSVSLSFARPGVYKVFADFAPQGRTKPITLGTDLFVAGGTFSPQPLPPPARSATVDGYTVTLRGDLVPGTASELVLSVSRAGAPVTDLEPYLGAYGHLVALRHGDLAYLHVHPDGVPGDASTQPGPDVTFYAEVPTDGVYRLFLDFKHGGEVRTAEFTQSTARTGATPTPAPSAAATAGHGDHSH